MADKLLFAASSSGGKCRIAAYIKDDRLCEVHFSDEATDTTVGQIYIGRVVSLSKNLQAAFVDIGIGQNCYCPVTEFAHARFTKKAGKAPFCVGDELLVQVSKEAVKTKAPVLSTYLSLSGTYVVVSTEQFGLRCSAKLSGEARTGLLAWFRKAIPDAAAPFGIVLRTNCNDPRTDREKILAEYVLLRDRLEKLLTKAPFLTCGSRLYAPDNGIARIVNRLPYTAYEEIVTDDAKEYARLAAQVDIPVRLYTDTMLPLAKLYNLDRQIAQALQTYVWLKSGASIVIEQTEALVAIDVNTGKYEHGTNREETFLKINKEAAKEIARQMRLRRLSGIIVIDFINLEDAAHNRELLAYLREVLADDPASPVVVEMTRLGLVEVTRRKSEIPLAKSVISCYDTIN